MQDRDQSPERASPRGRWNIGWADEWHHGHYSRGSWRNNYRYSRDGQVVEIQVSNYWKYQTTFIVDAEDFEKVRSISWCLLANKNHTYWSICHNQHRGNDPRLNGYPGLVNIARYLKNYTGPLQIDHLNRDTLDERQLNLRIATRKEQTNNQSLSRNNKTGENGISEGKTRYCWQVSYKQNDSFTIKEFRRDRQVDQLPENFFQWVREMRANGYDRDLNPYQVIHKAFYRFKWRENGNNCHKDFEFTNQGFEEAKRFRDGVYSRIRNYNGSEHPSDN